MRFGCVSFLLLLWFFSGPVSSFSGNHNNKKPFLPLRVINGGLQNGADLLRGGGGGGGNNNIQNITTTTLRNEYHSMVSSSSPPHNAPQQQQQRESSSSLRKLWKHRAALFGMMRPKNLPFLVLCHMLGVYLGVHHVQQTSRYWSILCTQPLLHLTHFGVFLVTASSMVVNDYYDEKLGRDKDKLDKQTDSTLDRSTVKNFLMILYSAALLNCALLPSVISRLAMTTSLILTFLYTKYLKPMTFVKNIVCSAIIAFAPYTSGAATLAVLGFGASNMSSTSLWVPRLVSYFGVMFCAILVRECNMDILDADADRESGIATIPIKYGRPFASNMALIVSCVAAGILLTPQLLQYIQLGQFATAGALRRFAFSIVAATHQVGRSWQVQRNRGQDTQQISRFVEEAHLQMVALMASFI